jgi:hypothetical protein
LNKNESQPHWNVFPSKFKWNIFQPFSF